MRRAISVVGALFLFTLSPAVPDTWPKSWFQIASGLLLVVLVVLAVWEHRHPKGLSEERKAAIRHQLSILILAGDGVANEIGVELNNPPNVLMGHLPTAGNRIAEWMADVRRYLAANPELGPDYVNLFMAQVEVGEHRHKEWAGVFTMASNERDLKAVRGRQDRLRKFIDDFR